MPWTTLNNMALGAGYLNICQNPDNQYWNTVFRIYSKITIYAKKQENVTYKQKKIYK